MIYLLDPRVWIFVALLALGPIGYMKGRHDGRAILAAETSAQALEASAEARRIEQRRQAMVDDAARVAAAREDRLRRDAAGAARQRDGLRDDLAAVRAHAQESIAACTVSLDATADVFSQCVRRYSEVAETADRHASDADRLWHSWPRD